MKTETLHKTLSKLVCDCESASYAGARARVANDRATVAGLPNEAGRRLNAEAKIREAARLTADLLPRLDAARKTVKAAHVAGKAAGLAALDALTEAARLGLSPVGWEAQALRDVAYQIEAAPTAAPDPTAKSKRPRLAVTQTESARIVGVTVRTIQDWEAGRGTPEGWPSRRDAVALRAFADCRTQQGKLKRALVNTGRGGDMSRYAAPRRDDPDEETED